VPRPGAPAARDLRLLRLATAVALLLGALLRWPALLAGFQTDDYQQLATLRGYFVLSRPPWDLFWFGPRDAHELTRLIDFGFDPWWTVPSHRLSMLRPLSSLLIAADNRLFGDAALGYHLHSLLWWAALVLAVSALLARLLPARVAALAIVLFALDEAHNLPFAWLANRSTLVSATFGTLALLAWLQARAPAPASVRRSLSFAAALALFALSLAAGEYGFGMLAYLAAYELAAARDPLRVRLAYLTGPLALAAAYLAVRAALGHGTSNSGEYIGPSEPIRYLGVAVSRSLALIADLVLGVPAAWLHGNTPLRNLLLERRLFTPETWHRLPDWQTFHVALGVAALLGAALLLHRLTRSRPELHALRWLLLGSLLALPAAAAATPSTRLLIAPEVGAAALIAAAVLAAFSSARRRATLVALGMALLCVHGALAAYRANSSSRTLREQAEAARRWALDAPIPRDAGHTDIVLVSAVDFTTIVNLPWVRRLYGLPLPRSYRLLSGAGQAHQLSRVDAHTLDVSVLSSNVQNAFAGSNHRPREQPLHVGDQFALPGMQVRVLAVRDGNPYRLRVHFDRDLDDPKLLFLQARPEGLRRFSPPPPGAPLLLPRAAEPSLAAHPLASVGAIH
jgi:hypothetical protein